MDLTFFCTFEKPRNLHVDGDELSLCLTMIPGGISGAEFLDRATNTALNIGYRLLGRTSGSGAIFEHRATIGRQLSDSEIEVQLWVPTRPFRTEPLRLLYINCLVEGDYWFQDRGHAGTLVPLHLADAKSPSERMPAL